MPEEINHNKSKVLLSYKNVDISFGSKGKSKTVVHNATFDIYEGETFSLVGESGSGKTTIGRAALRINSCSNGEILFDGKRISGKIDEKTKKEIKRSIQMVFQDPAASLNERATVEYIISEGLYNFKLYENEANRMEKVEKIIEDVGLLKEHLTRYPHEFSGGQRQRIGLARAIVMEPKLIVADEPISALDVSIRAQILNLLKKFQREKNLTYLFIAHDLSIVRFISDRIGVIYKGNIVEIASAEELFEYPIHPYTRALISAIPIPDPVLEKKKKLITYDPSIHDYTKESPSLEDIGNHHFVFGSKSEIQEYKKIRSSGKAIRSIQFDEEEEEIKKDVGRIEQADEYKDAHPRDSGRMIFRIVAFVFPIIGLISLYFLKKYKLISMYEQVKKGTKYGFIFYITIIGLWLLCLLMAVL